MIIEYVIPTLIFIFIFFGHWFMPDIMPSTLPFGVRIPPERVDEPIIKQIRQNYRTGLLLIAILMIAIGIWLIIAYTPLFINVGTPFVAILLMGTDYVLAHQRLRRIKEREGWYNGLRQAIATNIQAHDQQKTRIFSPWLISSIIILIMTIALTIVRYPALPAVIPTHFNAAGVPNGWMNKFSGVVSLSLTNILITAFFIVLIRYLPRTRIQLDPSNAERDLQRQLQQRQLVNKLLAITSLIINASFFFISLQTLQILPTNAQGGNTIMTTIIPLFPLAILATIVWLIIRMIRLRNQSGTQRQTTPYVLRNDDRYWLGGLFYSNPDDPALFVEKRFGIGWTINFGNPQAKWWILGFLAVILIFVVLPPLFLHP
ncbi:MAG TPA: DUF5808 domain-containing protein [Dictyobacter sp.]|jgi:uncharacterized membrane protein|nr:DUF5808 domain-containing protein [Dictyobacter sp.]